MTNINVSFRALNRKEMIWINLWLGKYHILSVLDRSSSNPHIFLARHLRLEEKRVIKKISKSHPFFHQLKKEADFLKRYKHPLIPELYEVEEDSENFYLILEYIEGRSLIEYKDEYLCENEVVVFVSKIFEFLKFLSLQNNRPLYIDWKPDNIVISGKDLKIIDFGSVIFEDNEEFIPLATYEFAAPELKNGDILGTYTDVYGFGKIVSYLATRIEDRKVFFFKNKKMRLLNLANKCTNENKLSRINIDEIDREIRKLLKLRGKELKRRWDLNHRLIGICGSENGVGTSHISLMILSELLRSKKRVAYVDLSENKVELKYLTIKRDRLRVYTEISSEDIPYLLNEDFENIIIDFGKVEGSFNKIFLSCTIKLLVVQDGIIKGSRLGKFLEEHRGMINDRDWKIILNLADQKSESNIRKLLKNLCIESDLISIGMEKVEFKYEYDKR